MERLTVDQNLTKQTLVVISNGATGIALTDERTLGLFCIFDAMDELCKRLWTNGSLRSLAMKLTGELYQDLLQEVALALLEQKKDVSSYFEFWCVRTMINMTSKNGTFWKLYSDRYIDQNEIRFQNELQYDPKADELWNELDKIFTKDEWYKREALRAYYECGSYRNVEKQIGINHVSVHKTVKEAKKIINDRTDYNIN